MLRSNLSSWFDLTIVMVIICTFAQNAEVQSTKLHLGILDTLHDNQEEMEEVQSGGSTFEKDNETFKRFQLSYALSALRHMHLSEESLFNSNEEFIYLRIDDFILFDVEAASMLASVQSVPVRKSLEDVLWLLWFYTDKVRRLLKAFSKGEVIDSLKPQFMFKAHRSVKESLQLFVESNMENFEDVQKKLDEIKKEKISDKEARRTLISKNKKLLNEQMAFNEKYGFSTDDKKYISFQSITTFDKLVEIGRIVVEYCDEPYWTNVEHELRNMYDTAMNLYVSISYQVIYLWHFKNGIFKLLKLVLLNLIESYAYSNNITSLDEAMKLKLSEFYECLGNTPYDDYSIEMFGDRSIYNNLYNDVMRNINTENEYCPSCTKIENISEYYSILFDKPKMVISKQIQEPQNVYLFVEKVKHLFSDVNKNIAKSFYLIPFAKSFEKFKEIENPIHATKEECTSI